ncbi:hypothetical protein BS50DRAFT_570287 [Corynespora cassiicola Philippines]|uniref:Stress-response A/B barrel domain-containing protein n=1 Tax=Corynespora cassiicola Philippines TaxID=1448308 RepID=A0A2T2NZG9_CORCC|nr:hypothetical protein BS50DRAFT_570287 [Corynespora cassiicola Philippines]
MSSEYVHRVTLFKIPDVENQEKLLAMYKTAQQKALKDGQPYIVAVDAGQTRDDARNKGFTVCAKTTFASMEDFEFYDKQCPAHSEIKKFASSVNEGSMMVYFTSVVP